MIPNCYRNVRYRIVLGVDASPIRIHSRYTVVIDEAASGSSQAIAMALVFARFSKASLGAWQNVVVCMMV